jgi:hypothetical protein
MNLDGLEAATKVRIKDSIQAGRVWLIENQVPGKARWKDYPNHPLGKESIALSGLVLHTLRVTEGASTTPVEELDRLWLDDIPNQLPSAADCEITQGVWIRVANDNVPSRMDFLRNYSLPWILIATTGALRSKEPHHLTSISALFQGVASSLHDATGQTADQPWIAAELEIALRCVQGDASKLVIF